MFFFLLCSYKNALGIILEVSTFLKDANLFHMIYLKDFILKQRSKEINYPFVTFHDQNSGHIFSKSCWEFWGLDMGLAAFEYNSTKAEWPWRSYWASVPPSINRYSTIHIIEFLWKSTKWQHVYFHFLSKQWLAINYKTVYQVS